MNVYGMSDLQLQQHNNNSNTTAFSTKQLKINVGSSAYNLVFSTEQLIFNFGLHLNFSWTHLGEATKLIRIPHEAEQRQKQHVVKLKKMREKRIQKRVKWWVLRPSNFFFFAFLLRPSHFTAGKGQLCDLTPHCSLLRRRHDWGASPRLLCTVFRYGTWTR